MWWRRRHVRMSEPYPAGNRGTPANQMWVSPMQADKFDMISTNDDQAVCCNGQPAVISLWMSSLLIDASVQSRTDRKELLTPFQLQSLMQRLTQEKARLGSTLKRPTPCTCKCLTKRKLCRARAAAFLRSKVDNALVTFLFDVLKSIEGHLWSFEELTIRAPVPHLA